MARNILKKSGRLSRQGAGKLNNKASRSSSRKGGKMSRVEAGRLGGEARAKIYSKQQLSQQAKKGARTIERKQPGFHSLIGQKGGEARGKSRARY